VNDVLVLFLWQTSVVSAKGLSAYFCQCFAMSHYEARQKPSNTIQMIKQNLENI